MKELETTMISKTTYEGFVQIECSPHGNNLFVIKKSNPDYVLLYNSLELGKTYKIFYKPPKIMGMGIFSKITGVTKPTTYVHTSDIMDFLNIRHEFPEITSHPHEIVLVDRKKHIRLLISDNNKNTIVIGQKYDIKYIKAFGFNLYRVLSINIPTDENTHTPIFRKYSRKL
jgi:hypothetical protein